MSELEDGVRRCYGKYRGTVLSVADPLQLGRILAEVPAVLGPTPSTWAMPCVPPVAASSGVLVVPGVGTQVWIEFEEGDPGRPIWSGVFWLDPADVPAGAPPT